MLQNNKFTASQVLRVTQESVGHAGVPCLNWNVSVRNNKLLVKDNLSARLKGAGLYGICCDEQVVYIGSYLGEGKGGAFITGNTASARFRRHFATITMRGHRVSISPTLQERLASVLPANHALIKQLLAADRKRLSRDDGFQASLRRIRFAADHWNTFSTASPEDLLERFHFVYVRLDAMPADKTAPTLKKEIKDAEKKLIKELAPRCNDTYVPRDKAAVEMTSDELSKRFRKELGAFL